METDMEGGPVTNMNEERFAGVVETDSSFKSLPA